MEGSDSITREEEWVVGKFKTDKGTILQSVMCLLNSLKQIKFRVWIKTDYESIKKKKKIVVPVK